MLPSARLTPLDPPPMIRPALLGLAAATLASGLSGCVKKIEAPFDPGVCYTVTQDKAAPGGKDGKLSYHKLATGVPTLETCAAGLEAVRLKFLAMGGTHNELVGSYQGQFIFVQKEGIFTAQSLDGVPYLALVRIGDGRLGPPGSQRAAP